MMRKVVSFDYPAAAVDLTVALVWAIVTPDCMATGAL
jgi:hypothetical protein